MSRNLKCLYCERYLSSRNAYSQHVKYCKDLNISTEESINDNSDITSSMLLDSENSNHIEELRSIREENLPSASEIFYRYESDSSYAGDISFHSSNIPEEFEIYEDILPDDLQNRTENSERDIPEEFEIFDNILPTSLQSYEELEKEPEVKEFPNEAYASLMTLIIENNLNNKAGNAIIKFFNKHSGLSQSPLPKNIGVGRKFMDKMSISHLS